MPAKMIIIFSKTGILFLHIKRTCDEYEQVLCFFSICQAWRYLDSKPA